MIGLENPSSRFLLLLDRLREFGSREPAFVEADVSETVVNVLKEFSVK